MVGTKQALVLARDVACMLPSCTKQASGCCRTTRGILFLERAESYGKEKLLSNQKALNKASPLAEDGGKQASIFGLVSRFLSAV